jgi:uncharacterized protein (TIGR02301 family)
MVADASSQPQPQGQQRPRPGQPATPAPQQPAPAPAAEPPAPPYEKDLLRLAEIMGSLAFLRSLCAGQDAGEWPARMQALLDAEGTTAGRKERLAGAYNRGYRGFALTYRVCTDSATEATNRYVKEGDQITRNLASRFGG